MLKRAGVLAAVVAGALSLWVGGGAGWPNGCC